jgi:uncharacterized protein (DUF2126 family)/transglutaminase-like putative cysteine protease
MTIRVALHHQTLYRYGKPISLGPQLIRLRPAYHARTPIEAYSLTIHPEDHFRNWQQDPYGNPIARYVFNKKTTELIITVDLIANMTVINPFDFFVEDEVDRYPFEYGDELKVQLTPYLLIEDESATLKEWVASMPKQADRMVDLLVKINSQFQAAIKYLVRMEPGVQTPTETLKLRSGSCRDSAWLMVQTFRRMGIAARFVSGYLIQLAADQPAIDGPSGPVNDFCDLHAWTEVYLPGAGWIGLDPTSGLFAGEGHIPLACTPSYTGAAPITGSHQICDDVEFEHVMTVSRYHELPRVTKPYTDAVWQSILQTGNQIDEKLIAGDVRLTMGGEPTFVSIDNMDDPQWTTEAVGAEKRVMSNLLIHRLRNRFAPGSLLHYGQGKWYPGESLPRWALACIARRDGEPIWHDDQWIADEGCDYGHTIEDAKRFVQDLSRKLNISAKMTFPVHEDTFHYLWRENRLPLDVDPLDPKLEDPNEREMVIRTFQNGLTTPVGFALPLRRAWWQAKPGWVSGRWPIRGEKVFLLPGNSPIGLRLPLEILPTSSVPYSFQYTTPLDPSAPLPPLPVQAGLPRGNSQEALRTSSAESNEKEKRKDINPQVLDEEDDDNLPTNDDIVRTALCVECRHGRLYVFMPPTQRTEDYLDLIEAVEETCVATQLPVLIEGYPPPPDYRLQDFKVTPDPGVIEVNTRPTASWKELVEMTQSLYDEARQCRLGTDKFDLDGRHTGTGGGNHIVMGAASVMDSPFLRRPDLLGSMIAFWNNHPAMSYLFSGKFIGPTSQAPRFDESRRDAVYELEIAMSQLKNSSSNVAPWMVDRLFRDLMTDLTGNTHRAEICIDKLYSPDSGTGRLGLVELRGFEMPPHFQMSLAQALLIRAIIAGFWERPYANRLVHWGSTLHDKFLLPHFVRQDLQDLTDELKSYGVTMDPQWFVPHLDFRFPVIGWAEYQGVRIELRDAIEPWYVLGEEPGGGGTARYVDSSLERIQIQVDGYNPERFSIVCNGIQVPMHSTGVSQQYVAGIKFRAWQPPRCLHPTIGVDAPLRFEIIDRNTSRSVGGCTYHVVDPSGRGTDRFPINANEAESRRAVRFERVGMTGGIVEPRSLDIDRRDRPMPITLDLRRK